MALEATCSRCEGKSEKGHGGGNMNEDYGPQHVLFYDVVKLVIALILLGITGLLLLEATSQSASLLSLLL